MANSYVWSINSLECLPTSNGQTDVVSKINYQVDGSDGTHTAFVFGVQPIIYVTGTPFTPYASLNQSEVIQWLQTALGSTQIENIQANLDSQISLLANPPVNNAPNLVTSALPWAK